MIQNEKLNRLLCIILGFTIMLCGILGFFLHEQSAITTMGVGVLLIRQNIKDL